MSAHASSGARPDRCSPSGSPSSSSSSGPSAMSAGACASFSAPVIAVSRGRRVLAVRQTVGAGLAAGERLRAARAQVRAVLVEAEVDERRST